MAASDVDLQLMKNQYQAADLDKFGMYDFFTLMSTTIKELMLQACHVLSPFYAHGLCQAHRHSALRIAFHIASDEMHETSASFRKF